LEAINYCELCYFGYWNNYTEYMAIVYESIMQIKNNETNSEEARKLL